VSRHLSALAESGLVDRTRSGACVFYRLSARGEALLNLF
jgi:DNA-binding transcriptional ArsR family regulator